MGNILNRLRLVVLISIFSLGFLYVSGQAYEKGSYAYLGYQFNEQNNLRVEANFKVLKFFSLGAVLNIARIEQFSPPFNMKQISGQGNVFADINLAPIIKLEKFDFNTGYRIGFASSGLRFGASYYFNDFIGLKAQYDKRLNIHSESFSNILDGANGFSISVFLKTYSLFDVDERYN